MDCIETSRLLLVPVTMKNFEARSVISGDAENTRFMMFLPVTSEENRAYIEKCEAEWQCKKQNVFEFDILLKSESNKFIGGISVELQNINSHLAKIFGNKTADIGWIIDKKYWNQGFVTEAAFAVLEFAKILGVKKVVAQCDSENIGSWRVMEKIGMKKYSDNGIRYNKSEPNLAKTEFMYTIDL